MPGSHNLIENKLFKIPFLCFLLKDNFCNYNNNREHFIWIASKVLIVLEDGSKKQVICIGKI